MSNLGGCHKVLLREKDVKEAFIKAGLKNIKIRSTTKVRGDKGELKCPGIIVTAIR